MKDKRYKVLDLFCGCGGLSEGFKMAGFEICQGIDFNQAAIDTYNKNFNNKGICADLTEVSSAKIQSLVPEINQIDVIIGGPPCQGFSSANRQQKEEFDERNKLFYQFLKFVDIAKPKAIVIENVKEILTKNNGYAKEQIIKLFQERGYNVTYKLLKASDYGVPQKRIRNFFVITKDFKFDFDVLTKKQEVITVKDALSDLYELEHLNNEEFNSIYIQNLYQSNKYLQYLKNGNLNIENHEIRYPSDATQEKMSHVPQGGNWKDIPEYLFKTQRNNRHSTAYKRLSESDVSCTIDTGNNHCNYYHPLFNRIPTVRESARLQSFKDSFVFCGSRTEQYKQVGNAVPPLLSMVIAKALKEVLDEK
ncbi:MAG: DNA cytosine methyltransferase [Clostridia bacterium]|nr:DNA cytosine methyltransferase [Clostridia bacterium]